MAQAPAGFIPDNTAPTGFIPDTPNKPVSTNPLSDIFSGLGASAAQPFASLSDEVREHKDNPLVKLLFNSNSPVVNQSMDQLDKAASTVPGNLTQSISKGVGVLAQWLIPGADVEKGAGLLGKVLPKVVEGGIRGFTQNPTPTGAAIGAASLGAGEALKVPFGKAMGKSIADRSGPYIKDALDHLPFHMKANPIIGGLLGAYEGRKEGPVGMAKGGAEGAAIGTGIQSLPYLVPFLMQHPNILSGLLTQGSKTLNKQDQ